MAPKVEVVVLLAIPTLLAAPVAGLPLIVVVGFSALADKGALAEVDPTFDAVPLVRADWTDDTAVFPESYFLMLRDSIDVLSLSICSLIISF